MQMYNLTPCGHYAFHEVSFDMSILKDASAYLVLHLLRRMMWWHVMHSSACWSPQCMVKRVCWLASCKHSDTPQTMLVDVESDMLDIAGQQSEQHRQGPAERSNWLPASIQPECGHCQPVSPQQDMASRPGSRYRRCSAYAGSPSPGASELAPRLHGKPVSLWQHRPGLHVRVPSYDFAGLPRSTCLRPGHRHLGRLLPLSSQGKCSGGLIRQNYTLRTLTVKR